MGKNQGGTTMKKRMLFLFIIITALFTGCNNDWQSVPRFDYELVGSWESMPENSYYYTGYTGSLEIDYRSITIKGYTGYAIYGSSLPFPGFTKDVPLKGYSQEGKIFINDRGTVQTGLPYTFWKDAVGGKYLTFTFSGREETLKEKKSDSY
jgi:hypothetical protein